MKFKRYCKTLALEDNFRLIEDYKKIHAPGACWTEITEGMKEVGILDMEIYIHGSQLFMIMDTIADFDHEQAMADLAKKPRQGEWEAYVSQFQQTSEDASADEKWQLMERIFEIDQENSYPAIEGQLKETYSNE
ncbi:L-rhamnose mutarotase [uncultured Sunxiuqinia sp.]|uniref:L-rhamnose mutarotase n=1 Tax=uncultured Sunxiuqinia sp. TaxID=1573825 RepID=UPI002AA83985|nr:L-rhamnose mutarotase [uncultured Sunxiuqinia sp.]